MIGSLQRLILEFNFLPSVELHPSRIKDYAPESSWQAISETRFGHRKLSAEILHQEGLANDWVTTFETRERRVALLGWQILDRLVLLAGAALNSQWISTRISGPEVTALRDGLGEQAYDFAVGRARFLGITKEWPTPNGSSDPISWLRQSGECYLRACVERQPTGLTKRLALRCPPSDDTVPPKSPLPRPNSLEAAMLFRKIAPEISPQCVSLFA